MEELLKKIKLLCWLILSYLVISDAIELIALLVKG